MSMYSLTHLTGRKRNADRTIVIATVETSKQGFIVSVVSILVGVVPTAVITMIFGPVALVIVPPIFVIAGLFLFRSRSQKGLQLPMYRMLLDKRAAKTLKGRILVCGVPIRKQTSMGRFVQSSELATETAATGTRDRTRRPGETAPAIGQKSVTNKPQTPSDLWD
jgi:hypothetical protein